MLADIEVLDLSRNKIGTELGERDTDGRRMEVGEAVGAALGEMIEGTDSLVDVDLSWNSIRGKGAVAIGAAMAHGLTLKRLDLKYNTFCDDGAAEVGQALHTNTVIESVDLSNNRVGERGAFFLASGFKSSESMTRLLLRHNPIGAAGARAVLSSITAGGKEMDIEGCDLRSGEGEAGAVPVFDRSKPNGKYRLDLTDAYDCSVVMELVDLAKKHGSECWKKPCIDKEPFTFDAATWTIPRDAVTSPDADGDGIISMEEYKALGKKRKGPVLTVEFHHKQRLTKMEDVVDKSSFDRLKSLLFRMNSTNSATSSGAKNEGAGGMQMLDLASKEFFFSADQVKDIVGLFDDDTERVGVLSQLFDRTVDVHKLDRTLDELTEKERGALRKSLGSLYFFDPQNPTGHYRLDVSDKLTRTNDAKLLEKLVLISNEEGALRSSLSFANCSQNGTWDCFRNATLDGESLSKGAGRKRWDKITANLPETLPESGVLEFDFVSGFLRAQCRNTVMPLPYLPSPYQLSVLCSSLPRAPEPSEFKSFHNLRLAIKPYLFTSQQAATVLEQLGKYPSIQTEAFIVLWGRIIDLNQMHRLFVELKPEQRTAIFQRLGVLNVWSPLFPTGDFTLDLADHDCRIAAQLLLALEKEEQGFMELKLRGKKVEASALGDGQSLKKGALKISNTPAAGSWDKRKAFCLQTLTGDEWRRPHIAEAFNMGKLTHAHLLNRRKLFSLCELGFVPRVLFLGPTQRCTVRRFSFSSVASLSGC